MGACSAKEQPPILNKQNTSSIKEHLNFTLSRPQTLKQLEENDDKVIFERSASFSRSITEQRFSYSMEHRSDSPVQVRRTIMERMESGTVKLNEYEIRGFLGKGSSAEVMSAYNTKNNQMYAIKILQQAKLTATSKHHPKRRSSFGLFMNRGEKEDMDSISGFEAVKKEIAIMKKLKHPNIVELVDVMHSSKHFFVVLEFVDKGALGDDNFNVEPHTEMELRHFFRDVLMGLEFLHFHSIAHMDLKPANLLRTSDNRVKITDFGVSHYFQNGDDTTLISRGTPAFVAPEIINENHQKFSARGTDIWALGVTFFLLVFLQLPFRGKDPLSLYNAIENNPLVFPLRDGVVSITGEMGDFVPLSASCEDLLTRMLTKDPANRITIADMKKHSWVTKDGKAPLPDIQEAQVTVTKEEIASSLSLLSNSIINKMMRARHRACARVSERHSHSIGGMPDSRRESLNHPFGLGKDDEASMLPSDGKLFPVDNPHGQSPATTDPSLLSRPSQKLQIFHNVDSLPLPFPVRSHMPGLGRPLRHPFSPLPPLPPSRISESQAIFRDI